MVSFSARVAKICAGLGYEHLEHEAKTVQRIAHMALYDANYEARRQRVSQYIHEEYPYPIDEPDAEPEVARFMRRSADDDDSERF